MSQQPGSWQTPDQLADPLCLLTSCLHPRSQAASSSLGPLTALVNSGSLSWGLSQNKAEAFQMEMDDP